MANKEVQYESFLREVNPAYQDFVHKINEFLLQNRCTVKVEMAKSGYVVSYLYNKRVVLNYIFRKKGMLIRIYGECVSAYIPFMETLPDGMLNDIKKAPACKRLADPATCNPRCSMGYIFDLKGEHHQKCKYNSFMFVLNDENNPFIGRFVENEVYARAAALA